MSILRSAALRLPIASRPAGVRFASSGGAYIAPAAKEFLEAHAIHDPRFLPGAQAYELDAPKVLPDNEFNNRRKAVFEHAASSTDLWRKISLYVCLPAILVASVYVYKLEVAHEAHLQHLIDENGGEVPERKVYSYMNMRTKPFPWGNQSLFFNPRYNVPAGDA